MRSFRQVNKFRFGLTIVLSVTTSISIYFVDNVISLPEVFNTILQAIMIGVAFMQCPETLSRKIPPKKIAE